MAFFAFNPNGPAHGRGRSHPQPHPFWDFIASMDNDYSDMRRGPSHGPRERAEREQAAQAGPAGQPQEQEKPEYKSPSVEDEQMSDTEARPAKRDVAGAEKSQDKKEEEHGSGDERWGRHCRRGGPRGMRNRGPPGPPPFGPFCFPQFGPDFGADFSDWTPRGRHGHGPRGHHHRGPPPPPEASEGFPQPPPEAAAARGRHGRHHCREGGFGRRGPRRDFNVPAFLSQLGQRLGLDLNGMAANLGVDLARATGTGESDFVPAHDLFDLPEEYLIHLSLPGARKDDIGLEFDGEHHTLRVGGVVYRPGIDETISSAIVHSGRNSEVGVFETKIRLPSSESDTVEVKADAINAKLREGVLAIRVPKVQKKKEDLRRSIRIDTPSSSPEPETQRTHPLDLPIHEKPISEQSRPLQPAPSPKGKDKETDADLDMYYSTPAHPVDAPTSGTQKGDHDTYNKKDLDRDAMHEDLPEQLPAYTPSQQNDEDFADDFGSGEEEGEYVKINVD